MTRTASTNNDARPGISGGAAQIRLLNDNEIEQVNGGFICWPLITYIIASYIRALL